MLAGCMQYTDLYRLPRNKGSMGTAAVMDSHSRQYKTIMIVAIPVTVWVIRETRKTVVY